ncbi:hypothetical protein MAR_015034 [Mya arenaria]|uniref:Uncharacterized protein n=1 Tax=Mya arenaria TaxID=6604 RepID=A0ABY7FG63_MYAAR|nr:acanthoscurrin-1-like [Mya arenaria]WAR21060.1 hypothetical protein MAR_015034 [Mya arenaria]
MNIKKTAVLLTALLLIDLMCLAEGQGYGRGGGRRRDRGWRGGGRGGGRGRGGDRGGGGGLLGGLGGVLGIAGAALGAAAITRGVTGMLGSGGGRGYVGGGGSIYNGGQYIPPHSHGVSQQYVPQYGGGSFYGMSGAVADPIYQGNVGGFGGGYVPPYIPQRPALAVAPAVIPSSQGSHNRGSRRVVIEENFDRGQHSNKGRPIVVGQPVFV